MTTGTVLAGLLKDFGLVEVLQVMELGGMTGALHLKRATGHMGIIYFSEGKMANCSEFDPGALTLGDVLQQLGMATYQHIEEAFSQQLHDPFGKRIGERLIVNGAISDKQLHEALRTKALWTIRELSLWKDGSYDFMPAPTVQKLLPYGEASLDIEVMRVTMEIIRYSDEWDALIKILPQGVRTSLRMSPAIPYTMRFDMRTLELFTHVNLYGRVRRIASIIRRPELDVARELARLVQQKFLLLAPQMETVQHGIAQNGKNNTNNNRVHLPEPAEKLRLENFELLNLISRMEQAWMKCRNPMEQLPAMVQFVNWTMDALADTCRANGTELDTNTLRTLMVNENLSNMGSYSFKVDQNHINVESFTSLCYEVMSGDMKKAEGFYDEATMVLHRLLCADLRNDQCPRRRSTRTSRKSGSVGSNV